MPNNFIAPKQLLNNWQIYQKSVKYLKISIPQLKNKLIYWKNDSFKTKLLSQHVIDNNI